MASQRIRNTILAALACWSLAAQAAPPAEPVVRSAAQLDAVLASGQRTPLDALTPYGKRRFLQMLSWSERGLAGLSWTFLVRELEPQQIAEVLVFLDNSDYLPMLLGQVSGAPIRLPAPTPDTEARFSEFLRFSREEDRRRYASDLALTSTDATRLERRYRELFGERLAGMPPGALPLGDLPVYFDAAVIAAEGRPDSLAARHLAQLHAELRLRGIDTRRTFDAARLRQLLQGRRYEEARAFMAGKPRLAGTVIPTVHDPLGPAYRGRSVYRYDAGARSLSREALPAAEMELVMVVDGGCHFSADALAALHEDAALRARLQGAGLTLIVPPRAAIDFGFIEQWNAANPTIPMRIPYSVDEWSAVDVADVPRFFLLKRGKVVGQVSGWPHGGNKAALFALLDQAARQE